MTLTFGHAGCWFRSGDTGIPVSASNTDHFKATGCPPANPLSSNLYQITLPNLCRSSWLNRDTWTLASSGTAGDDRAYSSRVIVRVTWMLLKVAPPFSSIEGGGKRWATTVN